MATGTLESECIALATAMQAFAPWHQACAELCQAFGFNSTEKKSVVRSKVFEDNNGCIATCTAPKMSPQTKHIAVKCHFVRNCFNLDPTQEPVFQHPFELEKIESEKQEADLIGFNEEKFVPLRKLLCGW